VLSRVYVDEDGILRNIAPEEITDEEARNVVEKMKELLEKIPFEKRRILSDFRKTRRVPFGARKICLEAKNLVPKGAVLVAATYQKIGASFVLRAGGASERIKIFTGEREALKWLKE